MKDPYEQLGLASDADDAKIRERTRNWCGSIPPTGRRSGSPRSTRPTSNARSGPAAEGQDPRDPLKADSLESVEARLRERLRDAGSRLRARRLGRLGMSDPIDIEDGPGAIPRVARRQAREAQSPDGRRAASSRRGTTVSAEFGLIDLVEEFTALRQELKLQTKSTRGLQEQAEALAAAAPPGDRAVSVRRPAGRSRRPGPRASRSPRASRPWTRPSSGAAREIEKARRLLVDEQALRELDGGPRRALQGPVVVPPPPIRRYHEQVDGGRQAVKPRAIGRRWFESLLEGFGLIQNRLRRVMQAEAIERIDCLGRARRSRADDRRRGRRRRPTRRPIPWSRSSGGATPGGAACSGSPRCGPAVAARRPDAAAGADDDDVRTG